MRLKRFGRCLTPLGWGMVAALGLALALVLFRSVGLSWDPLGLTARRLERAEAAAERGRAEALARQLEAAGRAEQSHRLEQTQARLRQLAEATAQTRTEARRAEDAQTPLDKARLDRLRAHDRQLCGGSAGLAGCPAAS